MNTAQLPRDILANVTAFAGADDLALRSSASAEDNAYDSLRGGALFCEIDEETVQGASHRSGQQTVDLFREDKTTFVSGAKCLKIMSAESYFSDRGPLGDSDPRSIAPQYFPGLENIGNSVPREQPAAQTGASNYSGCDQAGNQDASAASIPLWKRSLDLTLILLALPFWLLLMVVLATWVKIVSPGPIFFRQERVGFRGKRFMLFKFRTMKLNVETQSHERYLEQLIQQNTPMTKLDSSGDPRIIPGGRILRAMGLDELPQILNVLWGEMSLVGPRPCTVKEYDRYQPRHKERVNAAPGLTGFWQVNGKNKTTFAAMIEMDVYYSQNLSLWLDLAIIFRTPAAIAAQLFEARLRTRTQGNADKSFGNRYAR